MGDSLILTITELLPSRHKLKSVKLMNNRITDEIFPILMTRCQELNSLNLSYNQLTEQSLNYLEEEAEKGRLSNITLSNNKIVLRNVKDQLERLKNKGFNVSL